MPARTPDCTHRQMDDGLRARGAVPALCERVSGWVWLGGLCLNPSHTSVFLSAFIPCGSAPSLSPSVSVSVGLSSGLSPSLYLLLGSWPQPLSRSLCALTLLPCFLPLCPSALVSVSLSGSQGVSVTPCSLCLIVCPSPFLSPSLSLSDVLSQFLCFSFSAISVPPPPWALSDRVSSEAALQTQEAQHVLADLAPRPSHHREQRAGPGPGACPPEGRGLEVGSNMIVVPGRRGEEPGGPQSVWCRGVWAPLSTCLQPCSPSGGGACHTSQPLSCR